MGVCGGGLASSLSSSSVETWSQNGVSSQAKSDVFPTVPQPHPHHTNAWPTLERTPQQRRSSAVLLLLLVTYSVLLVMPRASPTVWRCGRWHIRAVKMCHNEIFFFSEGF